MPSEKQPEQTRSTSQKESSAAPARRGSNNLRGWRSDMHTAQAELARLHCDLIAWRVLEAGGVRANTQIWSLIRDEQSHAQIVMYERTFSKNPNQLCLNWTL